MSDLVQCVEKNILARRLFRNTRAVLVAVSGGLDSMVLLHLLERLSGQCHWRLAVAHFNHQLRGRSSDADERLVTRTATKLGLKFVSDHADVRDYAREHGLSLEMAARKLRHAFLARSAAKLKIPVIALAHHADDQVELFLLRLLRGAGGEGLAGMKWRNPSPNNPGVVLVRPLLDQPKTTLRAFARKERITFREDATNAQLDIRRNRIRQELIPLLVKNYQPALDRVILRQMEILGAEADFVTEAALAWLKRPQSRLFSDLALAVQRRCLQIQVTERGVVVNFDLIEQLRETADRPVALDETLFASRGKSGQLQFRHAESVAFNGHRAEARLRGRGGALSFDGVDITWEIDSDANGTVRALKGNINIEYFDARKVGSRIVLRHWQPGDRFQPIGMSASVKLQDLFTNQKVLRARRHQLIVGATAQGELFWVEGLRLAERFKLDKSTQHRLKWQWSRL